MDEGAEYFILRLDERGEERHVAACRAAILTYADRIQTTLPKLADDIRKRYGHFAHPGWPKQSPKPMRKAGSGMGLPPEHITDAHRERSDEPEDHQPDDQKGGPS